MTLIELAGMLAAVLMGAVVAFQLALAAGLPLGDATMGGRASHTDGVLDVPSRLIAVASAALLSLGAAIILSRAGVIDIGLPEGVVSVGASVVVIGSVLNTLTNLSGRHPLERYGMSAVTVLVAVLAGYVAITGAG